MDAIVLKPQSFDFATNNIEKMNLETLQRTYKENDTFGNPLKGVYHYQAIQKVEEICKKYNLNYEIEEIFAAQNKNKNLPGVVILPQVEQKYGEKSVESHVLRRIFTTIQIKDWETDELTTTLALTFHQDGLQAAIGPCVKICHNQCILSADRTVSNYGKDKVSTEEMFGKIDEWLSNFETQMTEDRERILKLKNRILSPQEIYILIGMLTTLRVAHDSSDKRLSGKVDTYPLNQSQITVFTEEVLKLMEERQQITAWDIYNIATEKYKPGKTEIPNLIPYNVAFVDLLFGPFAAVPESFIPEDNQAEFYE